MSQVHKLKNAMKTILFVPSLQTQKCNEIYFYLAQAHKLKKSMEFMFFGSLCSLAH